MKRRQFVKNAAIVAATIPLVSLTANAAELISPTDPTAAALKYVEDATSAQRTDKMGTPGAQQFCSNCRFYADETAEAAGCSLFRNQNVPAKAWCVGWVPRG